MMRESRAVARICLHARGIKRVVQAFLKGPKGERKGEIPKQSTRKSIKTLRLHIIHRSTPLASWYTNQRLNQSIYDTVAVADRC